MLPAIQTEEDFESIVNDESLLLPGAEKLAVQLGCATQSLRRYRTGSVPVYAVGSEYVLKLYPPFAAQRSITETKVLQHIHEKLPVSTSRVHKRGELENGWGFLLMTQLWGVLLADAWSQIPRSDQMRLAYTLLHVYSNLPWYMKILPPPPKPTLESMADTWFGNATKIRTAGI